MPVAVDNARRPKLGRVIARRIEDDISARGWPVGEVIASESELLERFEVSRAVLREAIRIVEHTGAAHMRRGPGGGLMVTEPRRSVVATAAGFYFASLGVTVPEMLDAGEPILEACIDLAAQRVRVEDARDVVDHMDEMAAYRRFGPDDFVDLGVRVAALGGNSVLTLFASALGDVGASRLRGTRAKLDPPITIDDSLRHLRGFRRLVGAITENDSAAALERIRMLNAGLRSRVHDRPAGPRVRPSVVDGQGKLAERVARLIRDDIERSGWQTGALLGSETDLIERYEVSRAVLREAVRILEFHGAVATRRGPGGGLFVTQPDQSGVVHSARVVLEYEGIEADEIWEAREVVESVCVRLAADRLDDAGALALKRALAAEAECVERGVVEHVVHRGIARVTGNRPMVLFINALAELSTAHVRGVLRKGDRPAPAIAEAHRAHELIVDSVLAGDADRAAGRMRKHVRTVAKGY